MVIPLLLLAVSSYFVFNAIHHSRGIDAQRHEQAALLQDQMALATADATRDRWQARVTALRHHAIARDMLDEQARSVLDLSRSGDLSVPMPPSKAASTSSH